MRDFGRSKTVIVDHQIKSFNVEIRTMGTVTPETIKRILETKLEVLAVTETASATYGLEKL